MQFIIINEKNVEIPMRDGTILRADIYRSQGAEPSPILLTRTPYNKDNHGVNTSRFVQAGYVVVIQDIRGCYASDGEMHFMRNERMDGYDTVEWVASQSWSNSKVGMFGGSFLGATQWLAAMEKPPHLKAIAPFVTASDYYEGWSHQGGVFQLGTIQWSLGNGNLMADKKIKAGIATEDDRDKLIFFLTNLPDTLKNRPMNNPALSDKFAPWLNEWMSHTEYDAYWESISPKEHYQDISIPVLNLGGWFDCFIGGTIENHLGMSKKKNIKGKELSRLIIGPWCHTSSTGIFMDLAFGPEASIQALDSDGLLLRFFDYWLKEEENSYTNEPAITYFLMGENVWKNADQWPLPQAQATCFYLHSRGQANSFRGNGSLNLKKPAMELEDKFLFDPHNPVPTKGGQTLLPPEGIVENAGPRDQSEVESRLDVLCYTSEVLIEKLEVIGSIKAVLYASSSAKDTDWTMKLVDVHPDGRPLNLTDGILRARYRNSFETQELLEPGKVYEYEIDLHSTANVFFPGHRIRIEISSSNYPRFEVNTNTGGIIAEEEEKHLTHAVNSIYHTVEYPSHIILPIMAAK